ncbi:MAG: SDR family oxidoreductase [Bacteroidota bacterium]
MYETKYHNDDLSDKSFLITGGAGFIGSHLVEYLLKYKAKKVRVLDNFSTGFHHNIESFKSNPAFELIEGDIRNIHECVKAVDGMDYVSHQAALGSVPRSINDPLTTNDVNITGFLNMLMASKQAGIKQFVYAASSSTYGDHPDLPKVEDKIGNPLSPYAVTKYVNELYSAVFSKTYNFHSLGLRYFNIFGPRQNVKGAYAAVIPLFIEAAILKNTPTINGDGMTSRDFTYVENAVQANIKGMLNITLDQSDVINIACNARTTLNNLWTIISDKAEISIEPKYNKERDGDVKHSLASIAKAKQLINYEPTVNLNTGLEITVDWFKLKNL